MPVTIDGTNGITSPGVDSTNLVLDGSTSGSITLLAPAVAGTNTQTLVAATGTLAPLISGTAVASTSGTSIDFTGIPSWVKRVTVMFNGVSTSGTSFKQIQLIDSIVRTTGYRSAGTRFNSTSLVESVATTGFLFNGNTTADDLFGNYVFTNVSGNTWVGSGGATYGSGLLVSSGGITLSSALTGVRITTVNGTDTFDAGTINILYE